MVDFFEAIKTLKPVEDTKKEEEKPSSHFNPPTIIRKPDYSPTHSGKGTVNPNAVFANGKVRIFTYGTLKRRNIRHHLLGADATLIAEAFLEPSFSLKQTSSSPGLMYPASGYPIALRKVLGEDKDRRVKGEIYEVPHATLRKLDIIENIGTMYHRERVSAIRLTEDPSIKEMYQCYAYIGIPSYWNTSHLYLCPAEDKPIPHYNFNPYAETTRSVPDVG